MSNFQKSYYYFFIVIVIINFSPLKSIAYFSPFIALIPYAMYERKFLTKLLLLLSLIVFGILFYNQVYADFSTQNFLLGVLTYSSILPILFIDSKLLDSSELLSKINKFLSNVFVIEGGIGIIQAIYGFSINGYIDLDNGDYVEGTIHLPLAAERSFSNPMFFSNMIGLLLIQLYFYFRYKFNISWKLWVGIISMILSSVVHAIFIFAVVTIISFLIIRPKFTTSKINKALKVLRGSLMIIFLFFLTSKLLKENINSIYSIFSETQNSDTNPRTAIINDVFYRIPITYPTMPFIGLGLGQFSSRASLMGSGNYLGGIGKSRTLPFLEKSINPIAKKYIITKMIDTMDISYYGSTQTPYFSLLSVFSEFGFLGVLIIFFKLLKLYKNLIQIKFKYSYNAFIVLTATLYVIAIGVQENYYEVPQAILIILLTAQLIYSDRQIIIKN